MKGKGPETDRSGLAQAYKIMTGVNSRPQDLLLGVRKEAANRTDGITPSPNQNNSQLRENQMSKRKV